MGGAQHCPFIEAAADKLASHLKFHFGELLQGRSHSRKIVSFSFINISAESLARLKRALGSLDSVQRMFSRRFTNGIYKVDLVPRRDENDLAGEVENMDIAGMRLEAGGKDAAGAIVYTLRSR